MRVEAFFEKFDQLADAPDAVTKMRELVFQLAVQGRLVQQDRTEESATVLLKRIRAARAALPATRRSGDETDTLELDKESTPFAAPPGWVWTSLGNVQVFTNGYAFKSEDYQPSGVGIIRMGELGANGEIDERNMKYVSNDIAQSLPDTFRVKPGDLLMGMSGSIGKLAINRSDKTYLLNQRVGRLEPILIEKAFLHVFLKTVEQHYLRISFGMAIKNLSTKQINETPFPIPPLAEQKRIVAKVDELMALCDRLEAQQQERETRHGALARASLARFADAPTPANLHFLFYPSYAIPPADLRKTILTLAFQGRLVAEQAGALPWTTRRLKDLTIKIGSGSTPLGGKESYKPEGTPLIRSMNVHFGKFVRDGLVFIDDQQAAKLDHVTVEADDVLLNITGASIGRVTVAPDDMAGARVNQHVAIVRSNGELLPRFLHLFLASPTVQDMIDEVQVGATREALTKGMIERFEVPVPALSTQLRLVERVDQLMALVDELEMQFTASSATAGKLMEAIVAELTAQV